MAYNVAKRLKVLKGLTTYEYICKIWGKRAGKFQNQSTPAYYGTKHLVMFLAGTQCIHCA